MKIFLVSRHSLYLSLPPCTLFHRVSDVYRPLAWSRVQQPNKIEKQIIQSLIPGLTLLIHHQIPLVYVHVYRHSDRSTHNACVSYTLPIFVPLPTHHFPLPPLPLPLSLRWQRPLACSLGPCLPASLALSGAHEFTHELAPFSPFSRVHPHRSFQEMNTFLYTIKYYTREGSRECLFSDFELWKSPVGRHFRRVDAGRYSQSQHPSIFSV